MDVSKEVNETDNKNEAFIYKWLRNDNGLLATYIQHSDVEDEDLVAGRESLSETLGLRMFYALEKEDRELFDESYKQLNTFFLENDGFVHWKLTEDGTSEVSTNAFIDDIRISNALLYAYEMWGDEKYVDTANTINAYISANNVNIGIFTDFYDREEAYASSNITLSYIDIQAMNRMAEQGSLNQQVVENTANVLTETPLRNGFYPKSYNVENETYAYDSDINMVDQAITAYHHAQAGNPSEELLRFIQEEMEENGVVYGMYNLETKAPAVDYESPAIYGFLILYLLEIGEEQTADDIFDRMKAFQVTNANSEYEGGYSITDGDTHIFDNIVPLIAEQSLQNHKQ